MSILNTSASGMSANQNWLSSISQNVANATTTGYKGIETEFTTMVDQAPGGPYVGEGVQTTTISYNALQGGVVSSTTATNLAVQGAGFFVVSDGAGNLLLTRNGSFVPDSSGNLVNSSGLYLMADDIRNGQTVSANSLSSLSKVNVESSGLTAAATTKGSLAVNLPSTEDDGTIVPTPTHQTSLVVYDSLGAAHTVNLVFTSTGTAAAPAWRIAAYDGASATAMNTQTLTFGSDGKLLSTSPNTIQFTVGGGVPTTLDLSNVTALATGFTVTSATADGSAPASLSGVSIATNGTLSYAYTNGASLDAYDIPLANVASPDNLSAVNGGAYTTSEASGPIFLGTAGLTLGTIRSSSLESSTVDLATELTNMIEAQSAYQANSKVFQTGANLLDILNNLKS